MTTALPMPAEVELILACARVKLDDATIQRVRELAGRSLDWTYVFEASQGHGVLPLVYSNLNVVCPQAAPPDVLSRFREQFLANCQETLLLTAELLKILKVFEDNGIAAIPYKGPALAASAYGNIGLRQFIDLDILIHKTDILKAKNLLVTQGFYPAVARTPAEEARLLKSREHYDYILMRNDHRFKVELHWGFARWYFPFALDPEGLWERAESLLLGGQRVPNLPPEDLLLILTQHGAKHRWQQLKWICDIAEVARTYGERIDWDETIRRAKALGAERIVLLGLWLAHDLSGVCLPAAVMQKIAAQAREINWMAGLTRKVLFPGVYGGLRHLERYSLYLAMRERRLDRARYFVYLARRVKPNQKDEEVVELPASLRLLYYLVRPVRLLREYGLSTIRRIVGF